jgi:hypothetical protein
MSNQKPTARIAVNKCLVPNGTNVYLKSGQEFEIELFNPTGKTVLAKIYINGESISNSGLVIRPGRREWIERYLDSPRKFKFNTYDVESNNQDVKNAIKNNGSIKVEFYNEQTVSNGYGLVLGNSGTFTYPYYERSFVNQPNLFYCTTGIGGITGSGQFTTTTSCNVNYSSQTKDLLTEETGRIEEGNASDQTFIECDNKFESYATSSVEYKLLPVSRKPVEMSDIKVYCTSCGTKQKKTSHKFCPNCGVRYE